MSRNRLEAFSDGVIAIIIAIMVPHGESFEALSPLIRMCSALSTTCCMHVTRLRGGLAGARTGPVLDLRI
jgi:hypothetical protein